METRNFPDNCTPDIGAAKAAPDVSGITVLLAVIEGHKLTLASVRQTLKESEIARSHAFSELRRLDDALIEGLKAWPRLGDRVAFLKWRLKDEYNAGYEDASHANPMRGE